jgi:signal recognition particle subunit SRP54
MLFSEENQARTRKLGSTVGQSPLLFRPLPLRLAYSRRSFPSAMWETLSTKLQKTLKTLRGFGKLSEKNVADALREVRVALLEADVNYNVAKDFIERVKTKSLGRVVLDSVTPGQQIVKIVHDELAALMGNDADPLAKPKFLQGNWMLVGLHGSGKTTTCGKLARLSAKNGRKPLLVACDVHRPAAITQLKTLGKQLGIPVFADENCKNVVEIARKAHEFSQQSGADLVIFDTAGRLHIDESLIQELVEMKNLLQPVEILLVADAATGQEAVNIAQHFDKALDLTGIILTKLDGDARGGAAISMRAVTGKPIRFAGVGEKLDDLEVFRGGRMAGRILGMGDVVSLVEKAQETFDAKQAEEMQEKLLSASFTLEDFLGQLQQIKKMGPLENLLGMLPGMGKMMPLDVDGTQLKGIEAIIQSMTPEERRHPEIINGSRRARIARGSGTTVAEVNDLLKQFGQMKRMMKDVGKWKKKMTHAQAQRGAVPKWIR